MVFAKISTKKTFLEKKKNREKILKKQKLKKIRAKKKG